MCVKDKRYPQGKKKKKKPRRDQEGRACGGMETALKAAPGLFRTGFGAGTGDLLPA